MPNKIMCDVCEGSGQETDAGGFPIDCHLCQGSGFLDWDEGEDEPEDRTEPTPQISKRIQS